VYKSINTYEPQAKFSTWLYKIATNLCLTNLKKKNLNISLDEIREKIGDLEDIKSENAQNLMQRKQLNDRVLKAISTLPEKERLAITLCKYQGLSYLEVSEALNCSVGAVKTHIFRGRSKLISILKPHIDEIN
jgi:RNA polymerase sigma-70 factor (ECF subfamily)